MRDMFNGSGDAQVGAANSNEPVFQNALDRECPDVLWAISDPTRSELHHIDSVAWVFSRETRGFTQVNWRDNSIAVELRAIAFALAQMAAL